MAAIHRDETIRCVPAMGALSSPRESDLRKARTGAPEPIAALNRIVIEDTGEPLVDLRTACPALKIRDGVLPFVRRRVADMVNEAIDSLPGDLRLRLMTALRTIDMQRELYERFARSLRDEHPEWSLATLRRATNRYVAPYDQPAPPGHCTGGAVDVVFTDPSGEFLDLLPPFDDWRIGHTDSTRVSPERQELRQRLLKTMTNVGFSNCRDEYWHYSFGDSAWAVRTGRDRCPYGLILPPSGP